MTLILDGSHSRATDLDVEIVRLAVSDFGFRISDSDMAEAFVRAERDSSELVSDLSPADAEALRWLAVEAEDWLNEYDDEHVYYVEESCLWRLDVCATCQEPVDQCECA